MTKFCGYVRCQKELSRVTQFGNELTDYKWAKKTFCHSGCGASQRKLDRDAKKGSIVEATNSFLYGGCTDGSRA
jgi:hypothetical protein